MSDSNEFATMIVKFIQLSFAYHLDNFLTSSERQFSSPLSLENSESHVEEISLRGKCLKKLQILSYEFFMLLYEMCNRFSTSTIL